jgi:multicomponent Na+:H+ antiporter subunit E
MTEARRPNPWNLLAWLYLAVLFLRELVLSAWDVILTTLSPRLAVNPAILAVPLDLRSDAGITLLADLITLTPGTTAIHVSEDRRTLFIHSINAASPEAVVAGIKSGFETAVRRVLP